MDMKRGVNSHLTVMMVIATATATAVHPLYENKAGMTMMRKTVIVIVVMTIILYNNNTIMPIQQQIIAAAATQ